MLTHILQLASPTLPVGAYTYSEGLEKLVENQIIHDHETLYHWLFQELNHGAIKIESALMIRAYNNSKNNNLDMLQYWNNWLSAARETEELRLQSHQMGRSLIKLIAQLKPETQPIINIIGNPCNYAIAYGLASYYLQIDHLSATISYIHSWTSNLINAGVKLIPLGQTSGQKILFTLNPHIQQIAEQIIILPDNELHCLSWGLSLASMQHETQYTRLFRS